jgi:anaerobic dimethyl sulfoxide reductase subunit C (anchor subunit)
VTARPLVAFTLLAQAAVGAFLALGALDVGAAALTGQAVPRPLADATLLAIGPVVALALGVSLLHLGTPAAAWRAVANLRRSWLSREVLLAVGFALTGAAFAALRLSGRGRAVLQPALAGATALAGVALVYAMARVYRVRTIPAWDTPLTTLSFFASALLLGSLAVGAALVLLPGVPGAPVAGPLRAMALAAAAGAGAELALPGRGRLHAVRRILLLGGLALALGFLLGGGRAPATIVAAFIVALAAEVLGRLLFYVEGSRKVL